MTKPIDKCERTLEKRAVAREKQTLETRGGIAKQLYRTLFCLALTGVCAVAQQSDLLLPSQSIAPAVVTADSGSKDSGNGKSWSKWYRLGVGKAPRGYTIHGVEFWLTGDRTCGVAAECREVLKSDNQVIWEFRLQGNDESGSSKVASSEGHIRVTYRPR